MDKDEYCEQKEEQLGNSSAPKQIFSPIFSMDEFGTEQEDVFEFSSERKKKNKFGVAMDEKDETLDISRQILQSLAKQSLGNER